MYLLYHYPSAIYPGNCMLPRINFAYMYKKYRLELVKLGMHHGVLKMPETILRSRRPERSEILPVVFSARGYPLR